MKRMNSLNIPAKSVQHKSDFTTSHRSLLLLEDTSTNSLALRQMILQKEEFPSPDDQQPDVAVGDKIDGRPTIKRNQRRSSEADLIRRSGKCRQHHKILPGSASFGPQ